MFSQALNGGTATGVWKQYCWSNDAATDSFVVLLDAGKLHLGLPGTGKVTPECLTCGGDPELLPPSQLVYFAQASALEGSPEGAVPPKEVPLPIR